LIEEYTVLHSNDRFDALEKQVEDSGSI